MTTQQSHAQMEGLATLLVLNDEVRKVANMREFGFFTTNETHRLIPYHMAFLWTKRELFGVDILAQSGTAELDTHAISNQWLKSQISNISASVQANKIHQVSLSEVVKQEASSIDFRWSDTFPNYLLWCPLVNKSDELNGGIIFLRESPFSEPEKKMITWLIASYQYTWLSFIKHKRFEITKYLKKKPILLAILAVLCFPIHLSVLATATVVAQNPMLINAPIDGVIRSFNVTPGQAVQAGQILFTLDKTELESNVEVSKKELMLTEAKLRTAINQGIDDARISAEVPILRAQLAIDKAHIQYTNELLAKSNVTSPINGMVVFDSKEDWVGQPVRTGERILFVANPKVVELKIMLPISNVIELSIGAQGDFFLFGKLESIPVELTALGYNAKLTPSKMLSYELTAKFVGPDTPPQLGAQGTVRLYGHRVPLIYYLIRRPLQAMRQSFGI